MTYREALFAVAGWQAAIVVRFVVDVIWDALDRRRIRRRYAEADTR